jgi:hypothetical protein
MRRSFACAVPVVAAVLLAPAAAAPSDSDASTKETRAMMHAYAKCVVKRQGSKASHALLANVDNSTILRDYPMLVIGDCLARQVLTTTEMRFGGDLYRYALADALVNQELASRPVPDLNAVPPLAQREALEPPQQTAPNGKKLSKKKYEEAVESHNRSLAYAFLGSYGECVVRVDTAGAKALLLTAPDSPEESAGISALRPAFAQCLPEGQTLKFGKVTLRGSIAINYYRLAHAAGAAATKSVG